MSGEGESSTSTNSSTSSSSSAFSNLTSTDIHINILPYRLKYFSLPVVHVPLFLNAFLATVSGTKNSFRSLIETADGRMTLILDDRTSKEFLYRVEQIVTSWCAATRTSLQTAADYAKTFQFLESPHSFLALQLYEGDDMGTFEVHSGLARSLSSIALENHFSIFYVSTFQADYLLLKETDLDPLLHHVRNHLGKKTSVTIHDDRGEREESGEKPQGEEKKQNSHHKQSSAGRKTGEGGGSGSGDADGPGGSDSSEPGGEMTPTTPGARSSSLGFPRSSTFSVAPGGASASSSSSAAASSVAGKISLVSSDSIRLHVLSQRLALISLTINEFHSLYERILQVIFFPPRQKFDSAASAAVSSPGAEPRFFCFSQIDDSLSMLLDQDSLAALSTSLSPPSSSPVLSAAPVFEYQMIHDRWRCIRVLGDFGFDECGLVSAISSPLTESGICPFYLSTYHTDFVLVQERKADAAINAFKKKFKVQ